jgi:lysozyme
MAKGAVMAAADAPVVALSIDKLCTQLKRDEGFKPKPYKDSEGVLTIGYGFNLESDGLTEYESSIVLSARAWRRYVELLTALPWVHKLDEARQAVLVNMAYNMGVVGELKFHITLDDVKAGNYDAAADEMLKSKWAEEVGPRAHRLAQQMRTGEWQ